MKKTILFGVACFAVLLAGCLPQEKLTGRVIDTTGPVSGAAVLGIVWVEDAAKIKPAPEVKNLLLEERDTALNTDMKTRGLPVAYARGISGDDGWFKLDKLHFSAETTRAIKTMQAPRITRVTVWAFQRGYRKQAVTTFLKDTAQEIPAATLLLFKPADWKELYRDNTVDSLTRDYMVKGYSKEFGATETEKDWILEYTHSNLWQAYVESDIKGDKEMEEMCGRDYSDLQITPEGIQRNPAHERCAELKQRMGAVREIEELWIAHANKREDPLAAAKEVVRRAIALLPTETPEPKEYESMILAGLEDAANSQVKGAMRNGLNDQPWQDTAINRYSSGDKAAAYRALGANLYGQLPEEIKQGMLTAQVSMNTIPGIKEKTAGFYLLMNRPLTVQLPNGDGGNHKDKPGYKVEVSSDPTGKGAEIKKEFKHGRMEFYSYEEKGAQHKGIKFFGPEGNEKKRILERGSVKKVGEKWVSESVMVGDEVEGSEVALVVTRKSEYGFDPGHERDSAAPGEYWDETLEVLSADGNMLAKKTFRTYPGVDLLTTSYWEAKASRSLSDIRSLRKRA